MSDHGHDDGHGDGQHFAHPMPVPMLLGVFGALTLLTIITVGQANFDFGSYDVFIVMFIATVKAILVGAFFMHLASDKPFNIIIFIGSFVFVGLFVIFTISDSQMTSKDFIQVDDAVPVTATAEGATTADGPAAEGEAAAGKAGEGKSAEGETEKDAAAKDAE